MERSRLWKRFVVFTPYEILRRYKYFNGPEGNSISDEESPEDYPTQQTTLPSTEDINQDQNLSESESYFQYRVKLRPSEMVVGQNSITESSRGRCARWASRVLVPVQGTTASPSVW